ncbi:hypothetical protein [Microcoleus sp. B4-D4]|uniref:hypothetical protein n=1 Tax=Microcoleus sp. B4-D4 TaxID=2818667 RepID=UPI002FD2A318
MPQQDLGISHKSAAEGWAKQGIGRSEAEGLARAGNWAERSGGIGPRRALGGAKRRDWVYLTTRSNRYL